MKLTQFKLLSEAEKTSLESRFVLPNNTETVVVNANGLPIEVRNGTHFACRIKSQGFICKGFHSHGRLR